MNTAKPYFLHGFSVQTAEALAEHTHRRIRAELGLAAERGKRYSWGYGACPDLAQHELVWHLLDVEKAIGARLTSAFQIVPEQSTAAIIIHHPQATYFNAAAVRELSPARPEGRTVPRRTFKRFKALEEVCRCAHSPR